MVGQLPKAPPPCLMIIKEGLYLSLSIIVNHNSLWTNTLIGSNWTSDTYWTNNDSITNNNWTNDTCWTGSDSIIGSN